MASEPDKFHVGVIDFFSILLPGAVLAFHVQHLTNTGVLKPVVSVPAVDGAAWVIFTVAAYIFGHFIFMLGSLLDPAYDALTEKLVPRATNAPLRAAIAIKTFYLQPRQLEEKAINAFQWTKCRLALAHPVALLHVQRFEADSKFFRSLFVVLLAMALTFSPAGSPGLAVACGALMLASLWRYADQRFKATRQAYWYLIALESNPPKTHA